MNHGVKPIETHYAGCRFRSRLEARWAVFFDHLGIAWDYEPQGFDLPSGLYLPDFWLPEIRKGIWYEAKGRIPTGVEQNLAHELATHTGSEVLIASGGIPWPPGEPTTGAIGRMAMIFYPSIDGCHCWDLPFDWCIGPISGRIGIEFAGIGSRVTDDDLTGPHEHTHDHPRLVAAYRAARSARFEHGESPA